MKNIKLPIIGFTCLLLGIGIGLSLQNNKKSPTRVEAIPTPSPVSDLSFYENLFQQNQEFALYDPQIIDLTGDGSQEVVYITAGEGCASCHQQFIRIFDDQKEIFNGHFDDPVFVSGDEAFKIFQPIRKEDEAYCCPTSYSLTTYTSNGQTFEEQK